MELPQHMLEILEDFKSLETNTEKYEELLVYAEQLDDMPSELQTKEHLVPGCTSVVYIATKLNEGKLQFYGSADSYLVKGLVAILVAGFSGMTKDDFLQITPDFLTELGLTETLSATRANASVNIFQMMQAQTKEVQE